MTKYKYMPSEGLAFGEEKDMERLSDYAKQGWILTGNQFLGYRLRKGEPQDLIYSVDTQQDADEDYFLIFKEAGWTHLYSMGDIHYFSAPSGTKPIYSDKDSLRERFEQDKRFCGKYAVHFLTIVLGSVLLLALAEYFALPHFISVILAVIFGMTLIPLVFTSMPYFAYRKKLRELA
ncbi:DUF2812 domain-containing protein [Gracilibacillus phocaeensis]|uniref:DUF2812 domain-containing protein n=1 Tax=Gracilibacillus phocaeensis TaxID=2042304 RepID=UPI0010321C52|nr:DUF2812 domain-containing protein [Gracilibacillus phocaeensis]